MMLQTEYDFVLPKGYVDRDGNLHREGTMRLASARDEILPLQDPRVRSNEAYLIVILLSRVVTRLGSLVDLNPGVIENLFASDLTYLQEFYNSINGAGTVAHRTTCPKCEETIDVELVASGES